MGNGVSLNRNYRLHMILRVGFHGVAVWGVLTAGFAWQGLFILALCYGVAMLSVTVGYHRYFAHRSFKTSRWFQLLMGALGCCQLQGGPIAWAAVHRHHHKHSDRALDLHSPNHGFFWSHMGWLMHPETYEVAFRELRDLQRFPELDWLDRFSWVPVLISFLFLWLVGAVWQGLSPGSIVTPLFVVFWGGVLRTVLVWHMTWAVNSVCHRWGRVAFETGDESRNNLLIAVLTTGEGWHNNHHHAPSCARSGLGWQQPDLAYGVICLLERAGFVWDVRHRPAPLTQVPAESPNR